MRGTASSSSFLRRVAVTASAVAFVSVAFASAQASASTTRVRPTINTFKAWDGSQNIQPFGCPNTTTYGQVITVPGTKTLLNKFTFAWVNYSGSGSMVVRGEVYAWDGSKATGAALFQSGTRTIAFSDALFHKEVFKPNGKSVTPGAQYVIFASIDKDFEKCTGDYTLGWASVDDGTYLDGTFVYQNNGGDETQWTSSAWTVYGADLAFKAYLS